MQAIVFILVLFAFALPAEAKKSRKPSNKFPKKVFTFSCKDQSAEFDLVLGVVNLSVDVRDPNVGMANTTVFLKKQRDFQSSRFSGRFTTVPGGFVLIGKTSIFPETVKLNVHPNEQTMLPGLPALDCSISGQMESI